MIGSLFSRFFTALGFLTRLAPARVVPDEEFSRSLVFFPFAGLVLGLILSIPFGFSYFLLHPTLSAFLILGLAVFLTSALHWDGLSDICDAWGSGGQGDRFWTILKDSRIGAFGVTGLILGLGAQFFLFRHCVLAKDWGLLVWSMVFGRSCAVFLAYMQRDNFRDGLGSLFLRGATVNVFLVCFFLTLLVGSIFTAFSVLVVSLLFFVPCLAVLTGLAQRQYGLNGDFLGAAIILGETAALLAGYFLHPTDVILA